MAQNSKRNWIEGIERIKFWAISQFIFFDGFLAISNYPPYDSYFVRAFKKKHFWSDFLEVVFLKSVSTNSMPLLQPNFVYFSEIKRIHCYRVYNNRGKPLSTHMLIESLYRLVSLSRAIHWNRVIWLSYSGVLLLFCGLFTDF